jgi:hypothetical protein
VKALTSQTARNHEDAIGFLSSSSGSAARQLRRRKRIF